MDFADLLKKWNGGIARGAQSAFAKKIGVAPNVVSMWTSGTLRPGELQRPRIATEFGISIAQVDSMFRKPAIPPDARESGAAYAVPTASGQEKITNYGRYEIMESKEGTFLLDREYGETWLFDKKQCAWMSIKK